MTPSEREGGTDEPLEDAEPPEGGAEEPLGEGNGAALEGEGTEAADGAGGEPPEPLSERLTERQLSEMRGAEKQAYRESSRRARKQRRDAKPRVKKLRFALVFTGLSLLAVVSWVFGVLMAVARICPISRPGPSTTGRRTRSSLDSKGNQLATLTGNEKRILLDSDEIGRR